jgi:hypothetical protein
MECNYNGIQIQWNVYTMECKYNGIQIQGMKLLLEKVIVVGDCV